LEVLKIQNHSLAGEAGLKVGDRIVAMNGQPIDDVKSLSRAIQSTRVGTTGVLRVVRGDRVADLSVPVVTRPIATDSPSGAATNTAAPNATTVTTSQPRQDNGVRLGVDIEDRPGVRGVIITSVTPNSPAATAGIQTGDRLVAVDGRMVVNSSALKQELSTRSKNNPMSIQLVRGSQVRASTVSFSANPANSSRTQTGPVADSKPSQSRTSASGSMFGNVGSMVGNLFGNAKTEATGTPDSNDVKKTSMTKQSNQPVTPIESTSKNSEQLPKVNDGLSLGKSILVQSEPAKPEPLTARPETTTPVVQPKPKENGSPIAQVDHTDDEMAFGDDEPINNAVFSQPLGADALSVETIPERSLETASSSAKTPSSDPPSAANITPPTSSRELELNPPENLSSSTKERIKALESELQRLKKLLGDQ
jgi:membrane-associated protease RseP (regulator of RpoE activity)